LGTKVFAIECDVSNPEAVAAASKKVREEMGDVDILINNAGIVSGKKLLDNNIKLIEKTIAVNATSHTYTIREFLPKMIE
jgi:short-subunit dehydrogenase